MNGYGEAAITRLSLTNFLTYEYVEFRPEPGLNMIIGPNGSGKSSLVCAICLALAGHTKVLGRAQHLKEFIKYGCETAQLEIELFRKNGNVVIHREISANKSQWKINGRPCKQDDVESTVAKLNIQVDNLCQFLPQDRVADFAKMTPQELLVGTEQAVGSLTLIENHEKLKTFQKTLTELVSKIKSVQSERDQNVQLNEHLEAELQTFREYQTAKTQLDLYEAKVAWLVYDEKRQDFLKRKEALKTCAAENAQKKANLTQIKKKLDEIEAQLADLGRKETAVELALRKTSEARNAARKEVATSMERIEEIQHQLSEQRDAENERKEKLKQHEQALNDLKNNYEESAKRIADDKVEESFEKVKNQMHRVNSEISQLIAERERFQVKLRNVDNDILETQTQIDQREQDGDQQLQLLKRLKPQVYDVCMWLRNNKSLFKKRIYEPPAAVMQVKTDQAAGYLDGAIGADSLFCFIAEDVDDMELFVKLTRNQGWRVNAAAAPRAGKHQYKPAIDVASVAMLGVSGFLSDLFDAPDAVFAFLCDNHQLHRIPYGTEKLEEGSYVLHDKLRMSTFVANDTWVNLIKSRYSSEITRCTKAVKNPKFLHASRDTSVKADLLVKLQRAREAKTTLSAQYTEIKNKMEELNNSLAAIKQEEKKLKQRLGEFNGLRDALRVKKSQTDRLKKEPTDPGGQIERAKRGQREIIQSFSKTFTLLWKLAAESEKQVQQLARIVWQIQDASAKKSSVHSSYVSSEQLLLSHDNVLAVLESKTRIARNEALDCLERAKTLVGFGNVGASATVELPEEYRRRFEPLTNEISELRDFIVDEKNRLSLLVPQNSNVEKEYEKRKELIVELQKTLDSATREQQRLLSMMDEVESRWKSELNELITKVDQKFSEFFSKLGCEGRISVHSGPDERQFDLYGIKIMVRFREQSELCELTPFHQSGGERSVSTILYMMALQELTVVPFRVVDEINQGMDSVNERRIFEFIVRTAEANNAQYFLITPKLLPDLPYSAKMHVHVITPNSRFNHTDWDFDAFLARRKALTDACS